MRVRYIYSACVSIETEDCTVLCDPWFNESYDGAWVQWPRIEKPLDVCGPADYVYISHVHPDHYDPAFLAQYLAKYPQAKVLIADHKPALLERKLQARGIQPIVIDNLASLDSGGTVLQIFANHASSGVNIDSALVVSTAELSVANLNDNPYDDVQVRNIRHACNGSPTVALLPFVGAGPWPQCYEFDTPEEQLKAAAAKKQKYLDLFSRYCDVLQPKMAVPFAGQYWLHGPRLDLNPLRGMADATECRALYSNVWVPADGGQSVLALGDQEGGITGVTQRRDPYDWQTVRDWLEHDDADNGTYEIFGDGYYPCLYRYQREIQAPVERLPLLKLLQSAVKKAHQAFADRRGLAICIRTQLPTWFHLTTNDWHLTEHARGVESANLPRVEVTLDARQLFGMLTRLYNANSVRIGSLCRFKCVPNVYDKELDDLFGEYWDSLRV